MRNRFIQRASMLAVGIVVAGLGLVGSPARLEAALMLDTCDGTEEPQSEGTKPEKRGHFEALADVTLSTKVEAKLNAIGERFHKKTGKTFVVTSGIRDPDGQAVLIYDKLASGEDLVKLYKDKTAALELVRVFESARDGKQSRSNTIAAIAGAIRAQMKRGVYISAHLKAGAADVRSSTMNPTEKRVFAETAKDAGLALMLEATPPHFHLQLE